MDELLRNQIFGIHTIAAAGSVTLGTALTYPLDTVKVIVQVGSGAGKPLTANQALDRVRYLSGYSGLYSGFGWLALGRIFGFGARFGTYEIMTAYFKDGREYNYLSLSEAFRAGLVAGVAESVISSPFELMKLREQVTSASRVPNYSSVRKKRVVAPLIEKLLHGYTPDKKALNYSVDLLSTLTNKHSNMTGALQAYPWMMTGSGTPPSVCNVRRLPDIISLEGWRSLWRGLRPGIVRDSVYGGIFFTTWQFLHQAMADWKAIGMNPVPSIYEDIPLSPLAVSLAAGLSGSVAGAASHCFDTAKCRSLCTVLPKFVSLERKLLKWKRPGTRFERFTGIHPADRKVLFNGIGLRMARCGIASFVVVGSYFLTVNSLVAKRK
ncbi:Mitochondrial carrier domain containing protein [Trema orientale]|uniref:Mitochondrial carrier domain containing protein n=1 Tax=Trema orientale TaxID=63057 RepID=A0A2P5CUC3_TREOI|nr:Mitochondrial carrier domain containing protein [Trema orientale]